MSGRRKFLLVLTDYKELFSTETKIILVHICYFTSHYSKSTQRNKQIAVGRKKFNMDPKKVLCFFCFFIYLAI